MEGISTTGESWEAVTRWNTHEGDAGEFVRQVLAREHPHVSDELRGNREYHEAIGRALARVLRREQDEEAEEIVLALQETLKDPGAVHGILHSDAVHSAALFELTHLEDAPQKKYRDILRFMHTFELSWDAVPEEVKTELRKNGPLPPMHEETV